jgi:hypothetical protein
VHRWEWHGIHVLVVEWYGGILVGHFHPVHVKLRVIGGLQGVNSGSALLRTW